MSEESAGAGRELRDRAASCLKRGDFEGQAEALRQLTISEPGEGMHLVRLADAHRRLGQLGLAVEVRLVAASTFARGGRLSHAIGACRGALALAPRNEEARRLLDELQVRRRESPSALRTPAPELEPNESEFPSLGTIAVAQLELDFRARDWKPRRDVEDVYLGEQEAEQPLPEEPAAPPGDEARRRRPYGELALVPGLAIRSAGATAIGNRQ